MKTAEKEPKKQQSVTSLRRRVSQLEKALKDCQEPAKTSLLTRDKHLQKKIYLMVTSTLLPIREYSEAIKEWINHYPEWWGFRDVVFNSGLFNDRWTNPAFRSGIDTLNDLCQPMDGRAVTLDDFDHWETGYRLAGFCEEKSNQDKFAAVQELISALIVIRENIEHDDIRGMLGEEEVNLMIAALKIISSLQKLWMDAEPEED